MGSALVRALLKHGFSTHVWNRTAVKCAPLAALGAGVAGSIEQAAAAAEIIIVNVSDYETADRLVQPTAVADALRGKLLVQLTSGAPKQARASASWAARHGIAYLDGAIMATPNFIGAPAGTILYSGPRDLFAANEAVFLALGGNAQHVGDDVGHAAALDLALLGQMWGALFGTLQAVAVCQAEGIALDTYATHHKAFGAVVEGAITDLVERARDGRYAGDAATLATLSAHHGAFKLLLELCADRGLNRLAPNAFDHLFKRAIAAGHIEDDFAALVPFMR